MENQGLRFAVHECFTVAGRGVMLLGDIQRGGAHVGDVVELVHAGHRVRARCLGVEMVLRRSPGGEAACVVGLVLSGVRSFTVVPGDHVESPAIERRRLDLPGS